MKNDVEDNERDEDQDCNNTNDCWSVWGDHAQTAIKPGEAESSVVIRKLYGQTDAGVERLLGSIQKPYDFFESAPRTCRRGLPEDFLDFPEITDRFHFAAVDAKDELVVD